MLRVKHVFLPQSYYQIHISIIPFRILDDAVLTLVTEEASEWFVDNDVSLSSTDSSYRHCKGENE